MEISQLGSGAVRLSARNVNLVCAPSPVKLASGILALTDASSDTATANPEVMVIDGPGEYEVGGALITGVAGAPAAEAADSLKAPTSYVFAAEDVTVGYLAAGAGALGDQQLEALGRVDVLVLPVGTGGFGPTAAATVIGQIEPRYILPVPSAAASGADWAEPFLKEVGAKPEKVAKLRLAAKDLPEEPVVVLLDKEAAKS